MSTPPFTVTPQIEAYIAGQVAQAVASERVAAERDLRRVHAELAEANGLRRHWEGMATSNADAASRVNRARPVLARPLPRLGRKRAAVARLDQITRILQEKP